MAKRIYWESIKKWAIRLGIPSASIVFLLFVYLQSLEIIEVTGYSGDVVCAGTIDEPCYAYINFTPREDVFIYRVGYDPWGRNTPFNFSDGIKDWKLQRSWGKGWRTIPLDTGCTGSWCGCYWCRKNTTAEYSIVFREGRNYRIRIVAYKEDAFQDVKWGFADVDPVWKKIGEYRKVSIAGRKYTPVCLADCHININLTFYRNLTLKKSDFRKVIKHKIGRYFKIRRWGIDYLVIKKENVSIPIYGNVTKNYQCHANFEVININATYSFGRCSGDYIFWEHTFEKHLVNGTENIIYWNETGQISSYQEERITYEWKEVPETIRIKANKSYIIDLWFHKEPELGFSSVDIVPKIKNYELPGLAFLNSTYTVRQKIAANGTVINFPYSINDTGLIKNISYWTQNTSEEIYLYCENSGCGSGAIAIGNNTAGGEKDWEREDTSDYGNNPTEVWGDDPVVIWHLHNNSALDSSKYARHGTNTSAPMSATGVFGNALKFDGIDDNITLPTVSFDTNNLTVSFWYRWHENNTDDTRDYFWVVDLLLGITMRTRQFEHNNTFEIYLLEQAPAWTSGYYHIDIAKGQWYYIVVVVNSTDTEVYINGTLNTVFVGLSDLHPEIGTNTLGGHGTGYFANASIDEFRIYNNTKSVAWIKEQYWNGIGNFSDLGTEETEAAVTNSMTLESPSDGSTVYNLTAATGNFNYTPIFHQAIHNCSLYTNESSWGLKVTNMSEVINNTENTITETFGSGGHYKWNVGCFNSTYELFASSNWTVMIDTSPLWNDTAGYLGSNTTTPDVGEAIILYAMGKDDFGLDYAVLSTNETGSWKNYTEEEVTWWWNKNCSSKKNITLASDTYTKGEVYNISITDSAILNGNKTNIRIIWNDTIDANTTIVNYTSSKIIISFMVYENISHADTNYSIYYNCSDFSEPVKRIFSIRKIHEVNTTYNFECAACPSIWKENSTHVVLGYHSIGNLDAAEDIVIMRYNFDTNMITDGQWILNSSDGDPSSQLSPGITNINNSWYVFHMVGEPQGSSYHVNSTDLYAWSAATSLTGNRRSTCHRVVPINSTHNWLLLSDGGEDLDFVPIRIADGSIGSATNLYNTVAAYIATDIIYKESENMYYLWYTTQETPWRFNRINCSASDDCSDTANWGNEEIIWTGPSGTFKAGADVVGFGDTALLMAEDNNTASPKPLNLYILNSSDWINFDYYMEFNESGVWYPLHHDMIKNDSHHIIYVYTGWYDTAASNEDAGKWAFAGYMKVNWYIGEKNVSYTLGSEINLTAGAYRSPKDMGDVTTWTWSNFTWQNSSVPGGTIVGWRIYYNDTNGYENGTDIKAFTVQAAAVTISSYLNGTGASKYYERGYPANITGLTTSGTVCLSLEGYLDNFACGTNRIEYDWIARSVESKFNDTSTIENLTSNTTVYIQFNNESIVFINTTWNLTGYDTSSYPEDVEIYIGYVDGRNGTTTFVNSSGNSSATYPIDKDDVGNSFNISENYYVQNISIFIKNNTGCANDVLTLSIRNWTSTGTGMSYIANSSRGGTALGVWNWVNFSFNNTFLKKDTNYTFTVRTDCPDNTIDYLIYFDDANPYANGELLDPYGGGWDGNEDLLFTIYYMSTNTSDNYLSNSLPGKFYSNYIQLDELNNTNTAENITFDDAGSEFIYFELPRRANITYAKLNLTGYAVEEGNNRTFFNLQAANLYPFGIVRNRTNIWILDHMLSDLFRYDIDGNFEGQTSIAMTYPRGITMNDTFFFITDYVNEKINLFDHNGTDSGIAWNTAGNDNPRAIDTNGTHFFVSHYGTGNITIYDNNGNFTSWLNLTASRTGNAFIYGVTIDDTYLWASDYIDEKVYKYYLNGTYVSNFSVNQFTTSFEVYGLEQDGKYFYSVNRGGGYRRVYKYWMELYPNNSYLNVGNDIDIDWNCTTELNESVSPNQTVDLSSEFSDYLWSSDCTELTCDVPVVLHSDTVGIINISAIDIRYNPNPINLNKTLIRDYLTVDSAEVPFKITASNWGTLQIDDLNFSYYGSQNYTVFAHTSDYSTNSTKYTLSVVYSNFSATLPSSFMTEPIFLPNTNNSRNVSCWGQDSTTPAYNITNDAYDRPFNLSVRVNQSLDSCMNMTAGDSDTAYNISMVNTTHQVLFESLTYQEERGIWLKMNYYNCNHSTMYRDWWIEITSCCDICSPCW